MESARGQVLMCVFEDTLNNLPLPNKIRSVPIGLDSEDSYMLTNETFYTIK